MARSESKHGGGSAYVCSYNVRERARESITHPCDNYRLGWLGTAPGWGSLFPQNAWESALPAACRPPQTGPPIITGQLLCLFLSTPLLQSKS